MDREGILWVLEEIGAKKVLPHGSNVQLSCPLAQWREGHKQGIDNSPSMGILVAPYGESKVHCFACKFGGDLTKLVRVLHQYGDKDLTHVMIRVEELEEIDPDYLVGSIEDYDSPVRVYTEKVIDESRIEHMLRKTHPYLLKRGIYIPTLLRWGTGFDNTEKRIVFPVRRKDGDLVGMVGRAIHKWQLPRYINYFDFDKGRYLYGEHLIKQGTSIVVCEGILDALCVWQSFLADSQLHQYSVVSTMGADMTPYQAQKLMLYTDDVILFLDNDPAGWSGNLTAAKLLQDKLILRAVKYPSPLGGDPAELYSRGMHLFPLVDNSDLIFV